MSVTSKKYTNRRRDMFHLRESHSKGILDILPEKFTCHRVTEAGGGGGGGGGGGVGVLFPIYERKRGIVCAALVQPGIGYSIIFRETNQVQ